MSCNVPIVHVPHDTSHAREPQPGGPGVILVTALPTNAHSHGEEDCADKVNGDEDEDDSTRVVSEAM